MSAAACLRAPKRRIGPQTPLATWDELWGGPGAGNVAAEGGVRFLENSLAGPKPGGIIYRTVGIQEVLDEWSREAC